VTNDQYDYQFVGGNVPVIWAFGATTTFQYHGATRMSGFSLNFFNGGGIVAVATMVDFRAAHGILMMFVWVLLITSTTYLARFLKDIGHAWFLIHRILNSISVIISLAAWIEIIVLLGYYRAGGHHILGTIIIAFSLVQPVLGFLANKFYKPDREKTPIFPDRIHIQLGRLFILASFVQVYLGFCAYGVHVAVWGLYSAWLVIILFIDILSEFIIGGVTHDANHKGPNEAKLKRAKILIGIMIGSGVIFFVAISAVMVLVRTNLVTCIGY